MGRNMGGNIGDNMGGTAGGNMGGTAGGTAHLRKFTNGSSHKLLMQHMTSSDCWIIWTSLL